MKKPRRYGGAFLCVIYVSGKNKMHLKQESRYSNTAAGLSNLSNLLTFLCKTFNQYGLENEVNTQVQLFSEVEIEVANVGFNTSSFSFVLSIRVTQATESTFNHEVFGHEVSDTRQYVYVEASVAFSFVAFYFSVTETVAGICFSKECKFALANHVVVANEYTRSDIQGFSFYITGCSRNFFVAKLSFSKNTDYPVGVQCVTYFRANTKRSIGGFVVSVFYFR